MSERLVNCIKLGQSLPGLAYPPVPGPLGDRIWLEVSADGWKEFLEHFKRVMNENRLQGGTEQATSAFYDQAEKFFFGGGVDAPAEYKPEH